jgi:hypothetical protein
MLSRLAGRARGVRGPAAGRRRASLAGLLLAMTAVVLPPVGAGPPATAAERLLRFSGKVERVDLLEGLVVVTELIERGRARRHELYVPDDTPIVTASRLSPWQIGSGSAYEEIPVALIDLLTGDFVVVDATVEGGRGLAVRITIVEGRRASPVLNPTAKP